MRRRPLAGLVLSLLVATTAGAMTFERAPGTDQRGGLAAGAPLPTAGAGTTPAAAPLPAPPGRTFLVSRKPSGQPFPNGGSIEPSVSADGRFVAFTSIATDLVAAPDQPNTLDVFVVDRQTGRVTRAPRPTSNGDGIGSSSEPAISADGNVVAFTWQAPVSAPQSPTATPTPTPVILYAAVPQTYVYAWDRRTGDLQPVSASSRGGRLPGAHQPTISANGRYVAYTTSLDVLDDKDDNADDVVWFDRRTNQTVLVSAGAQDHPIAGYANQPSISGDGNLVAFTSTGGDTLVQRPTGPGAQVYVRDMARATVDEVSVAADGGAPNGPANDPAISGDGAFVAFVSSATNLVAGGVATQTAMVYRRELASGTNVLISVQPTGAPSAGGALAPAITTDGGMVAFASTASDLVPETAGRIATSAVALPPTDVYIRDVGAGETVLASVTLDHTGTGARSIQPAVAGLGRYIVFASSSDRLVTKDGNETFDVFLRDLPPTPVLTPPTLDLGARAVGTESLPGAATLANAGWSPLRVAGSAITGPNAKDFRVVADGCQGRSLKRNEACTVSVVFKPSGKGARSATLSIADALPATRLAVALRGRASLAKLVLTPAVGQPGTVVIVEGSGFPDGARVALRWDKGITQRMDPVVAKGGRFRVQVLIFHNDLTGERQLLASPVDGTSVPAISAPALVTRPSAIPPTFLVAPRFVDLPLVLVFR